MTPRVYFQRGGHLLIGPLGCFDKGDVVDVPERGEYVVVGVEVDGAAWARNGERTNYTLPHQGPEMAAVIRANRAANGLPPVETKAAA